MGSYNRNQCARVECDTFIYDADTVCDECAEVYNLCTKCGFGIHIGETCEDFDTRANSEIESILRPTKNKGIEYQITGKLLFRSRTIDSLIKELDNLTLEQANRLPTDLIIHYFRIKEYDADIAQLRASAGAED